MLVVGLTGGIGSGKSTVSKLLAELGAVVIDADAIVHEVQAPGGLAYQPMVDHFGSAVVGPDGTFDRQAIAEIVFNDPEQLAALNAIVHPIVGQVLMGRLEAQSETDNVVILDVPLLVESGRSDMAGLIVVDAPVGMAVARAVARGAAGEDDVRARIAKQATRDERLAKADFVIDNSGSLEDLRTQVAKAWRWIQDLR
ncbi:MAG: dephospho-CoA kinase [Actinomycetota bacterium]|jgi:dephospho-CoA kinase